MIIRVDLEVDLAADVDRDSPTGITTAAHDKLVEALDGSGFGIVAGPGRADGREAAGVPPAWAELLEALTLLARGVSDDIDDMLTVHVDPGKFTDAQLARLAELGLHPNRADGRFYSFRFGSA